MSYHGISLELEDMDAGYAEQCVSATLQSIAAPIVVNDLAQTCDSVTTVNILNRVLQNKIEGEMVDNTPICDVKCPLPAVGRYNLNKICPTCGNKVTEMQMESSVWVEAPYEAGSFINPRFWMLFNAYFSKLSIRKFSRKDQTLDRGPDLLAWMVDPTYRTNLAPTKTKSRYKSAIELLESWNHVRDINYFRSNFRTIMGKLTDSEVWHKLMGTGLSKREGANDKHAESERERLRWIQFVNENQKYIFTRYLPILSPMLIVAEEDDGTVVVDPVFTSAVDVPKNIASIYHHPRALPVNNIIGRSMKANRQLAYFYTDFRKEVKSKKTGIYRAKNSSTHIAFSGRVTISPIIEPHDPYEMWAPWRWFVNLYSIQIESRLRLMDYTPEQILTIIDYACMQYCPLVDGIIDQLIAESPGGKGIMVVPLRNPTLVQLAVQTLYITRVIKDVNQCSIRISVKVIKEPNADFDGDQFQIWLPVDATEMHLAQRLLPEHGAISAGKPNEVASGLVLHNELIAMQCRFLQEIDEE